jgi:hypothetical protein
MDVAAAIWTSSPIGGQDPKLKQLSAALGSRGSAYAELTLTIEGCSIHPCTVIVGVDRTADQAAIRTALENQLREHVARHRASR